MKKILSVLLILVLCFSLAACGQKTENKPSESQNEKVEKLDTKCNIFAINGPTGLGLVSLMDKAENKEGNLDYTISTVGTNDAIVAKVVNKEADIAAVATNQASALYKATNGGITVLAVNTLGVLNIVAKGEEISSVKDLAGKTVYTTGQGANPEYISKFVLEQNGLKVGDNVNLEFVSQPQELVTKVVSSEKAIVIAPQPIATLITVKDSNAKIVININDEWNKFSETELVMGCIIARKEWAEKNPQAVKIFLKDYEKSILAVSNDIDNVATLSEKYGIISPAAVVKKAAPYCNIVFQTGKNMKTNLSAYLKFMFDNNPKSVGGELPAKDFYYEAN